MGLSRSSTSVGAENGRPDWSMKMVGGDDVFVEVVSFCHVLLCRVFYFVFGIFIFLWVLIDG